MNRLGFLRRFWAVPAIPFLAPEALCETPEPPAVKKNESDNPFRGGPAIITLNDDAGPYAKMYLSERDTVVFHNEHTGKWTEI